jgi:parallel beta-helix repeat protein
MIQKKKILWVMKMSKRCNRDKNSLTFVVIFATLAFISVECASGATHYVNLGESIQTAIDAADLDDIIIVKDGIYAENINVSKRLTIQSENGPDKTIIQTAAPEDPVFNVSAGHVDISGFTVKGADTGIDLNIVDYCNISGNNCSYNHIGIHLLLSNNNTISNNICSNNTAVGISIFYSNNNSISNNNCPNNNDSIYLWGSNTNRISSNTCSSNTDVGIRLLGSNNNSISNNTCSNSGEGIFLVGSTNNIISNNNCSNNSENGFFLFGNGISLFGDCINNKICNNICSNNSENGISLLADSNINCISNNNCSNNLEYGIYLRESKNNIISNNTCSNNVVGINFWDSNSNLIYLNNFINNVFNTRGTFSTNTWNSIEKITYTYNGATYTNYLGNYWDDYTGTDVDGDGIGDTPYWREGLYENNYPLMEPGENYFKKPNPDNFSGKCLCNQEDATEFYSKSGEVGAAFISSYSLSLFIKYAIFFSEYESIRSMSPTSLGGYYF